MPFDFAGSSAELCNETAQNMPPSFSSSTVSHGRHVPGTFRSQLTRSQPFRLARSTGITVKRETKGALRYQETDDKGEPIEQAWAKIGTFYIRKSAFERGQAFPQILEVTVGYVGMPQ
jgi:hypothetical protein